MNISLKPGTDIQSALLSRLRMTNKPNEAVNITIDEAIYKDTDFFQFLIYSFLRTTALPRQDYYLLSIFYRKLNLFDNKKLLSMLKTNFRGDQYYDLGEGKASNGTSFSNTIYEDIITLAATDLATNPESFLTPDFLKYLNNIKDLPENIEIARKGLKSLYEYRETGTFKEFDENIIVGYNNYLLSKDTTRDLLKGSFEKTAERMLGISNLKNNRDYQNFLQRTIKAICSFLGVKKESDIYSLVRGSLAYDHTPTPNPKAECFTEIADIFTYNLGFFNFGNDLIKPTAPNASDSYLKDILYDTINSSLLEELNSMRDMQLSKANISNIEALLDRFVFSFYEMALLAAISDLLSTYYKNFSLDKVDRIEEIKTLNKELFVLSGQLKDIRVKYDKLKSKADTLERKLRSKQRDEDRVFLDRISRLEKDNEQLQSEKNKLEEKLKLQEDYIKMLELPEEELEEEGTYEDLVGKKFLFIGGREETINQLKSMFPSSIYTSNETEAVNLENVDYVVMFTKFMSHALYYKYIGIAREYGIKVIYLSNSNIDMIVQKLIKETK